MFLHLFFQILRVIIFKGNLITSVSWTIQATITSTTDPNAKLVYQTQAQVVNGYANFTNLGVSSSSSQYPSSQ